MNIYLGNKSYNKGYKDYRQHMHDIVRENNFASPAEAQ